MEKEKVKDAKNRSSDYDTPESQMTVVNDFSENIYSLEDRLIRFAGEIKWWFRKVKKDEVVKYYGVQLLRSSGSAALNYGEASGTQTDREFIHKMGIVHRELRECKMNVSVLLYGEESITLEEILSETLELMAISAKMILNKQNMSK